MLEEKYNPKNAPNISKVKKQYRNARLQRGQNPDTFITDMEDLKNKLAEMDIITEDRDFMSDIIEYLPKEYETQQALLEQKLGTSKDDCELTLKYLRETLKTRYDRLYPRGTVARDHRPREMAFAAGGNGKQCTICGKIGHRAHQCRWKGKKRHPDKSNSAKRGPKPPQGLKDPSNIKCHHCGKRGHIKKNCFKYQREQANKNVRPDQGDVVLSTIG